MNQYYSQGEVINFPNETIKIYLETKLDLRQKLKHENNHKNFLFFSEDPNWSYVNQNNKKDYDIKMYIHYDQSIQYDGFHLDISREQIIIKVSEYRGVIYALDTLAKLHKGRTLEIARIKETPTIQHRGIIEGFYGIPWTQDNRLDMLDFMKNHKMNTYFYAPKDDVYHRKLWREPYPENDQDRIIELIQKSQSNHIDFVYCLSPGNDIDLTNTEDIKILSKKLLSVHSQGVDSFAILFDDINYDLNDTEKRAFKTPGIAHSILANKVYDEIKKETEHFKLYICPTEYFQNWDTPYRQDMNKTLYKDIDVFFTGYNTIAKEITEEDYELVYQSFGHKLAVWDNYPTNDVNKDRLFLGPLLNRVKDLNNQFVSTYVSNPMNQWQLSKIALKTMASYMWDSISYNETTDRKSVV